MRVSCVKIVDTDMKRLNIAILSLTASMVLLAPTLRAQDDDDDVAKRTVIEAVQNSDNKEELASALTKAKSKGATSQQILEGKILWAVFRAEDAEYYQTIVTEVEKATTNWLGKEAIALKKPKNVQATAHFMAALKAHANGEDATAEKEILQAIWLDPTADKYIKTISKIQPIDAKIQMDMTIETTDGKKVTLAEYAKDKKAVYIQIWASWCGPCLHLFPVLNSRAKSLPPQGVAVVAMNSEMGRETDGGGNALKAKKLKLEHEMQLPWLVEPKGSPYTELLEIDSVPRAIVVDPQGKVLFNDHPMDKGLVLVLKKLGANLDIKAGMKKDDDQQ